MATFLREGVLNASGALTALEYAQSLSLSYFSSPTGVVDMAEKMKTLPTPAQTFLLNMASSLSGACHVQWADGLAWNPLVASLMLHTSPANTSTSTLAGLQYDIMVHGQDRRATRQGVARAICDAPAMAMVMLLRWLRTDLVDCEHHLRKIVDTRT